MLDKIRTKIHTHKIFHTHTHSHTHTLTHTHTHSHTQPFLEVHFIQKKRQGKRIVEFLLFK